MAVTPFAAVKVYKKKKEKNKLIFQKKRNILIFWIFLFSKIEIENVLWDSFLKDAGLGISAMLKSKTTNFIFIILHSHFVTYKVVMNVTKIKLSVENFPEMEAFGWATSFATRLSPFSRVT